MDEKKHKIDFTKLTIMTIIALSTLMVIGLSIQDTAQYNSDKRAWKDVCKSINNQEYEPKTISNGKIFKVQGNLFVQVDDGHVFLCKAYND